ncbi:MAG: AMP-binding protein, partial [Candidatus Velamenicoccus archaeovorus]
MVVQGDVLWRPSEERIARSNLARYLAWLREERSRSFDGYDELWAWSVDDLEGFWSSLSDFFELRWHRRPDAVLPDRRMPGAVWFPGGELNYAEHALARRDEGTAVLSGDESGALGSLSRAEVVARVGAAAAGLRRLGVRRGDRVCAIVSNRPEALIAFLATASLGAVWSSCSPDFGARAVTDRFRQIEPTVLIAVDGYRYGGKGYDRLPVLAEIRRELPTLRATVLVPALREELASAELDGATPWDELLSEPAEPEPVPVPFEHPLWILYSSGTTGLPKAIVQGHGGILLEHLKSLSLHCDLGPEDRFSWFTTTGWMM